MKTIKKVFLAVAIIAMGAFVLTGCGSDSTSDSDVYKVGIIQQLEHQSLDEATEGFKQAMIDELGKENVEFDYQNAQGEQANCATIANQFVNDDVDLIMANATTALQAASAATAEIPVVGTSITDYITAGVIETNEAPGGNVTGASDLSPVDQQIDSLLELAPDCKTVGIIYCNAEANSVYQVNIAEKELKDAGKEVKTYTVADSNDIQSVVTKASQEVDAMYIPTDNTLANNMEIVKNITVPAKIPVIVGAEMMCEGALSSLSISYYDMGYQAGLMACKILVDGADPAEMPIEYAKDVTLKYNAEIAKELGITVPDNYEAIEFEE